MAREHSVITDVPERWNHITESVIGAAIEVHRALGPGLLEKFYEEAMCHELGARGVPFERQHRIALSYKGKEIGEHFLDLVIDRFLIVELKAVERVADVHLAQLVSSMKSGGFPLGLLLNFNVGLLKEGIFRRAATKQTPLPDAFHDDSSPRVSANLRSSAFQSH